MEIRTYNFNDAGRQSVAVHAKGKDWPVVYMIHNNTDLYIGETTSAYTRMGQHLQNPAKSHLQVMEIVFDDTFNKSVVLDFEQMLIRYCTADGQFANILNRNAGQSATHDYYQRTQYGNDFRKLWAELVTKRLAKNSMDVIENQNIFKYSPYNSLTQEQENISVDVINNIIDSLTTGANAISLINGCAGTGKTVLAISIINSLINAVSLDLSDIPEEEQGTAKIQALLRVKEYVQKHGKLRIGFVFPMSGIRETIGAVFKASGNGLSDSMVIGPNDVAKQEYDILFVDESHRLAKRKNIVSYQSYDNTCAALGMDKFKANQLDWVINRAKYKVLFYDRDQSIKGSDIPYDEYQHSLHAYGDIIKEYTLETQMRCQGGNSYISYVKAIMNAESPDFVSVDNYDFRLFDDVDAMISRIRQKNAEMGLCRTVAGFSWEWKTDPRKNKRIKTYDDIVNAGLYDIDIQGHHYIWNLTTSGWINRTDSDLTIGCIHTTQGFDLNYVGVIFGKEIDYNPATGRIEVDLSKFFDKNVKNGTDPAVVREYIINTYTTMLARGIKGCYVYACNPNLQAYLKNFIPQ